jgi:hypothetical protein
VSPLDPEPQLRLGAEIPAASVAVRWKVCFPGLTLNVFGEWQEAKAFPSSRQRKVAPGSELVNTNLAVAFGLRVLIVVPGFFVIWALGVVESSV